MGEYRWLLDHGTPLHGSRGEFTGYIGSCTDITDRIKFAEQQLLRLQEQLEHELAGTQVSMGLGPGSWRSATGAWC